ncbi:MAG: hypothetical protein CMB99_12730 [Flavobacteriaceae bacterium]|nr:hypothetical protein [Flavobacteriaceae bacterium]|tara:strand:- start:96277 stop:96813 length:537 start_codon:yes stop_codon:yes gene_type:complete
MFTFSKRHYGLVVLILVLAYKGINLGDFCYDLVDKFIVGGIGLLFFMVTLVVTFYNLYHISLKEEFFDYFPLVFLVLFAGLFYVSFYNPEMDFYKTTTGTFQKQNATNSQLKLKLFSDNTFFMEERDGRQKCYTKGSYEKSGEALKLNFNEGNNVSRVYRINLLNGMLIGRDTLKTLE